MIYMLSQSFGKLACAVLFCTAALFATPTVVFAGDPFSVSPAVIDGEGKVREILRYKVTILNEAKHTLSIYPWARDLDAGGEVTNREGVDPAESLIAWLEFSRSVINISAGEMVELPIQIQVNLRAKPGMYHAVLHFSDGPNRAEAELNTDETRSLSMHIRVPDDAGDPEGPAAFVPERNDRDGDRRAGTADDFDGELRVRGRGGQRSERE